MTSPYTRKAVQDTLDMSVRELADMFETTTQAIYKWGDEPIPLERQVWLRTTFPRKFPEPRA